MIKQKIWKSQNKFFQGFNFRPITLNEKMTIAFLAGIVFWLTVERVIWYFMGILKIWL